VELINDVVVISPEGGVLLIHLPVLENQSIMVDSNHVVGFYERFQLFACLNDDSFSRILLLFESYHFDPVGL
jgi:hypothetical protein